jgi:hypothetical protein
MSHCGNDPREVVRRGYNGIGPRYLRWRGLDRATVSVLNRALEALMFKNRTCALPRFENVWTLPGGMQTYVPAGASTKSFPSLR